MTTWIEFPATTELNALSAKHGTFGVPYMETGQVPFFQNKLSRSWLIDTVFGPIGGGLAVCKSSAGALKFGVMAGKWFWGGQLVEFAEVAGTQDLVDDDTNYIYLTVDGTLTVNQSGFPDPTDTAHIRLATIATGTASAAGVSGAYAWADITDYRSAAAFTPASASPGQIIEANTAGVGAPNVITTAENGKTFTNEGCTAKNHHTLPAAAAGLRYTFVVADADGMRITAGAGDTIRIFDVVSKAAGYVDSTTIGAAVTLTAVNATEWIAHPVTGQGAWAVETS